MKRLDLLSALALLSLGACSTPTGGYSGGPFVPLDSGAASADAPAVTDAQTAADVPAATPDVPAATPDVPAATPDVPVAAPDVPVATPDVPVTAPDVPVATPDVPAPMSRCGDGACTGAENCGNCPNDCGVCPVSGPVTDACGAGAPTGPGRNCGWRTGMTFSCSPGRATMVGCSGATGAGSLCQPSYGACTGDPVMRVCAGSAPCAAAMALIPAAGSFDDQCGTCPSAYVTCPPSGQIHVITGDYDSNQPTQRGTCAPAVR